MKILKNKTVLALLGIVLLGTFLRFYNLGELSFNADEFLDVNSSYGYAQTGEWQAWNFNEEAVEEENVFAPRDRRAWGYKIQVATLFNFLPPTETVARSVSATWGVLTILLMYFVAASFTGKRTIGLLSAFLFSISIVGIEFDRTLRMYAMFFPVFLAFSWLFFKFFEGKYLGKVKSFKSLSDKYQINFLYLIPMLLVGFLSMHLHALTINMAVIFAVYVFGWAMYHYSKKESLNNKYFISSAAIVLAFLLGISFFAEKMNIYLSGLTFFEDHYSYFGKALVDYSHPLIAIIFLLLGVYYLTQKTQKKREGYWLTASFLAVLFSAVFLWSRNVGPQYIFFAQSFEMILIASGIYYAAIFFKKHLAQKFGKKAFWVPLILALALLPAWGYFFQENNAYRANSRASSPDYRKIFTYVKKKSDKGDALITRTFRNYYFSGAGLVAYDFGGERTEEKVTIEMIQFVMDSHPTGWIVFSDNDETYVTKEAEEFMNDNLERVNAIPVRGAVNVYRWE